MHYAIKAHNYEVLSEYWRDIWVYAREETRLMELIYIGLESNFRDFLESLRPLCSGDRGVFLFLKRSAKYGDQLKSCTFQKASSGPKGTSI